MPMIEGGNIANVERVKITTVGDNPKTYVFNTASSATFTAVSDEGSENTLRIKNKIHGLIKTDTLVKGYDIEFQDQKLLMEVYALIDGGEYTAGDGDDLEKYEGPVAGSSVERTAFDITFYTSDRDNGGNSLGYHQWFFPNCKGKPVEGSFKDQEFATNTYKLESRAGNGEHAMTVERIATLPAVQ